MKDDSIVREVRRIREAHAAKFDYECGKKPLFDKKGAVLQDEIT